ncbi:trehalose-phosphatase [Falsiroseomonas sp.]|uniref:trehalose-phosphatase n=1 Tax=Falsiroseomonas sp. TaxID=2870721 RepID=UPI0027164E20|nr:trehalose-phosphatase [Falsiroseomonas sp.]MDO9498491.1 trehalose-phosphatase [Falsiroseomonas sp.]
MRVSPDAAYLQEIRPIASLTARLRPLPPPPPELLRDAALLLDFDGTLVEIADRPDAIVVPASLVALLERLGTALAGRVAIISGRSVDSIRAWLPGLTLAVSGSHGAELHWPGLPVTAPPRPAALDLAVAAMRDLAQQHGGIEVEDKPLGAALHYRMAPGCQLLCEALAASLARTHDLYVQHGKMMVELRPRGFDKGAALRAIMAAPAMQGARPVFIGDDLTDRPAMVAARDLGGDAIIVGNIDMSPAHYRLADVGGALAWLDAACPA